MLQSFSVFAHYPHLYPPSADAASVASQVGAIDWPDSLPENGGSVIDKITY